MDAYTLSRILRWIHILAAGAWLGQVAVVVFILVPIAKRAERDRRGWFIATVFPRVFRLASVLSATVIVAGAGLYLSFNNWHLNLNRLITEQWGWAILLGGTLGLGLMLFHFIAESRLEPVVVAAGRGEIDEDVLLRRLTIIPRVGLGVLVAVFGAMMYAARGI